MEPKQEAAKGLNRKERIDLYIRVIGMIAIFTPLLLFYMQSCNEKQRQASASKKEERKSIYEMQMQITSQLYTFIHSKLNSNEQNQACNKLSCDLYAQIKLMEDPFVENRYNRLMKFIDNYKILSEVEILNDSMYDGFLYPIYNKLADRNVNLKSDLTMESKFYKDYLKMAEDYGYTLSLKTDDYKDLQNAYRLDTNLQDHKNVDNSLQVCNKLMFCYLSCTVVLDSMFHNPPKDNVALKAFIGRLGNVTNDLYYMKDSLTLQKRSIGEYAKTEMIKELNNGIKEHITSVNTGN